MCDSCGRGETNSGPLDVHERILAVNDRTARHNREFFEDCGIVAVNLMGSPGSGKTAVLEATARVLGEKARLGVLGGDLATDNDAQRIGEAGMVAEWIATGTACHLDAEMVHKGVHRMAWRGLDYLFMVNSRHLACPALYDLGQAVNVVTLSIAEGEDTPLKYPLMFRTADLVLVTKVDLLPQLPEVSLNTIVHNLSFVMPHPAMLAVSAKTGLGIGEWVRWLNGFGNPRGARCVVPSMIGAP